MKTEHTEIAESDAIRSEIEQTRESMDETLEQIGEHMKPRRLLDDIVNIFRSEHDTGKSNVSVVAGKMATSVAGVVREHPIPTLLIGAGIVWAMYERRHRHGNGNGNGYHLETPHDAFRESERSFAEEQQLYAGQAEPSKGEKVKEKLSAAREQIKEKGAQIGQRVAEGGRTVAQKASEISRGAADRMKQGYQVSRDKIVQVSDENPLCVGAGFLAAGVLLGLALPATHREDQLVGPASDRLKSRAREKGEDLLQRGKHVASAAADAARKTAGEEGLSMSREGKQVEQSQTPSLAPAANMPPGVGQPAPGI